jgi:rubredoxin
MSSAKKIFFRLCPQFMMRPAIAAVNKGREFRAKMETFLFPQKSKLYCPCCGAKSKSFVAGSYADYPERFNPVRYEDTKQDVLCPVCRSLPRHRIRRLLSLQTKMVQWKFLLFWMKKHTEDHFLMIC